MSSNLGALVSAGLLLPFALAPLAAQVPLDWMRAHLLESRSEHAMVYDAQRERIVLFGGYDGANFSPGYLRGDTWEMIGDTWAQRAPANSPPPRYEHAMVFDSGRGRVV